MKKFETPEVTAFEYSLKDVVMTSSFAEYGDGTPTESVDDPASNISDNWGDL